jgi:hypothetical protein
MKIKLNEIAIRDIAKGYVNDWKCHSGCPPEQGKISHE